MSLVIAVPRLILAWLWKKITGRKIPKD